MVTLTYQERFKTIKGVFDEFTNRALFELESRDVFDQLLHLIYVGKESNVFLARKGKEKLIVKIFRLQNTDFRKMYDYIRKDTRYEFLKKHRRDIIFAWAQREYKNLMKAQAAKINSPKPYVFRSHIIVEEMIGDDEPAPALKDAKPLNPKAFFEQIITQMRTLYKAGLIHGDLSAFNILNYKEKPYLIDFSQGTVITTPNCKELLQRDVKNMVSFFRRLGVKYDEEEVLKRIVS